MDKTIILSKPQIEILQSRQPLNLIMAGQRGGKSFGIGLRSGYFITNFSNVPGFIGSNTYKQLSQSTLKEVRKAWKNIYGLFEYDKTTNPNGHFVVNKQPPKHFVKHHDFDSYNGIVSFLNGGIIFIGSLDNYTAHEGKELGWAELDETKDTKEDALKQVILGRLSYPGIFYNNETFELFYSNEKQQNATPFNPCYINTSPALGDTPWLTDMFGLNDYQQEILFDVQQENKGFFKLERNNKKVVIYSTHHNQRNLPDNYISIRLSSLSTGEGLRMIYGYPFSRSGGEFYPSYDKFKHVNKVDYRIALPIHISLDFNVLPYMTMLCCQIDKDYQNKKYYVRVFKEYCLKNPLNSTQKISERFKEDFENYDPEVFFYGDASGDYRQAGNGENTQFDTLREVLSNLIGGYSDRVPTHNPSIMKRRDLLERIFEGKLWIDGLQVVIEIDENCTELQRDLQFLKLGTNGKLKERYTDPQTGASYEKIGHTSDALEYFIAYIFNDYL